MSLSDFSTEYTGKRDRLQFIFRVFMGKLTQKSQEVIMERRDITPATFPNDLFWKFAIRPEDVDPFGSYTGVPKEFRDMPVQDADDL